VASDARRAVAQAGSGSGSARWGRGGRR
jgi:hypothetical protein